MLGFFYGAGRAAWQERLKGRQKVILAMPAGEAWAARQRARRLAGAQLEEVVLPRRQVDVEAGVAHFAAAALVSIV